MKAIVKAFVVAVLLAVSCTVANAWPSCPGVWNQVSNGTAATGSSGQIGEIYTADGITWQCQSKTPTPPAGGNSGANSSSASNSTSNSTSTGGTSNAGSTSNASGGNATGGNSTSTANGGSVSSKNTNNNTANGGAGGNAQGGAGGSSQSNSNASANGNGNGSNNFTTDTNVAASKIPVATAIGLAPSPTVTCLNSVGAGVQTMAVGGSLGFGHVDKNCAILETARAGALYGNKMAFCKVYLKDKYVKQSGLTLDECLVTPQLTPQPAVVASQPVSLPTPVAPTEVRIVTVPAPVADPVPAISNVGTIHYIGEFKMDQVPGSGVCPSPRALVTPAGKNVLDLALETVPDHGKIIIAGTPRNAIASMRYLSLHIPKERVMIRIDDNQDATVSVSTWEVQ